MVDFLPIKRALDSSEHVNGDHANLHVLCAVIATR